MGLKKSFYLKKTVFFCFASLIEGIAGNPSQLPAVAAASNSCRSIQQSLQPTAVAVTSGNSPAFVSKCQTWKLFPSHRRSSPVTAWYNYIIIATFEKLKQPQGLKQPPLLVSGAAPVKCFQNCLKLFKLLLRQVSSQPVIQWLLFLW